MFAAEAAIHTIRSIVEVNISEKCHLRNCKLSPPKLVSDLSTTSRVTSTVVYVHLIKRWFAKIIKSLDASTPGCSNRGVHNMVMVTTAAARNSIACTTTVSTV